MKLIRNAEDVFFDGVIVPLSTERKRKERSGAEKGRETYWLPVAIKARDAASIPRNADEVVATIRSRRTDSPIFSDPRIVAAVADLVMRLHEREGSGDPSAVPESTYALV